ncbi:hypothetical protein AAVH_08158 [Aphelenchoides avenae]|nr:hypothetical protein AAVH_08158 [Aphelenchus avenae]
MQRPTLSVQGLWSEQVVHADGSVTITVRGCGNAACADENCAFHEGVMTMDLDANGKFTCNVPDHLRPLLLAFVAQKQEEAKKRQQDEETNKRLRQELEKKLAQLTKEIQAADAFLAVLHNLHSCPVWEEETAFVGQKKAEKDVERTTILQQIRALGDLHE